jgi:putative sigma-54 modulation protein
MDVEYTGRHDAVVTDEMRTLAGPYLDRMEKMLGGGSSAHVIVTAEKYRQIAEVTVKTHAQDLVGLCESTGSMETALRQALEKTEAQAIRFKEKRATQKRLPKDEKAVVEPALERGGKGKRTALLNTPDSPLDEVLGLQPDIAPGTPVVSRTSANGSWSIQSEMSSEPHVTRTIDAIALRPMSLEEAVKELETRNREIFIFRDKAGSFRVLHCKRDGTLELIELP